MSSGKTPGRQTKSKQPFQVTPTQGYAFMQAVHFLFADTTTLQQALEPE